MKRIKPINRIILLVAVITAFVLECEAQQYDISVPSTNYVPSAQSWSFVKYGGTPVDLYTGTARVDIPIYTYSDPDFTIPISVGFASNGFIPFRHTGVVGLNWFLSAGGVITREIRGIDDLTEDPNIGVILTVNGYGKYISDATNPNDHTYPKYSEQALLNFDYGGSENGFYYVLPGHRETEADIYHFNFMGHSGSFHIDGQKKIRVYNTNGNNGIYDIKFTGQDNTKQHRITITTGDGYIYNFGHIAGTSQYYEKQISGHMTHTTSDYYLNDYYDKHIVSWMLHEIIAPNGRRVTFNYQAEVDLSSTLTGSTFYDASITNKSNIIVSEIPGIASLRINVGLPQEPGYEESLFSYRIMNVLQTTYLTSIIIDGDVLIDFNYSLKAGREISQQHLNEYATNPYAKFIQNLNKLDKISVKYNDTDTLVESTFHYRVKDLRTILDSVHIRGVGTYKMEYYEDHPYPDLSSSAQDFWGYYNGRDDNTYFCYAPIMIEPVTYDEIVVNDFKDPNAEYSIIGNLKRIKYPTGGYTEFEYEAHDARFARFAGNKFNPPLGSGYLIDLPSTYIPDIPEDAIDSMKYIPEGWYPPLFSMGVKFDVGGVRIRRITDHDGLGGASSKVYNYNVYNEYTDGILLHFPRFSHGHANGHILFMPLISLPSNTFDRSHIEYRSVRETFLDGSSIESHYSNFITNPDDYIGQCSLSFEGPPNGYGVNEEFLTTLNRLVNSRHSERGKLTKKVYLNSNRDTIKKEEYNYIRSDTSYTASIKPSYRTFWSSKTYTGDYRMVSSSNVDYFYKPNAIDSLVSTTTLEYNDFGQVNKVTDTLTNGSIRTKHISYFYSELYKTPIYRVINTIDSPEQVVSEQFMEYKSVPYGSLHIKPSKYFNKEFSEPILYSDIIKPSNQSPGINFLPPIDTTTIITSGIPDITYKYDTDYMSRRLQETIDRNGVPTSYIWGYGGLYVVAVIKNVPYDQLPQSVTSASISQGLSMQQESALRAIPNAEVTTMKYEPFVGVTEITEPSRRKLTYTYTTTGKLSHITDEDGNIINKYEYSME